MPQRGLSVFDAIHAPLVTQFDLDLPITFVELARDDAPDEPAWTRDRLLCEQGVSRGRSCELTRLLQRRTSHGLERGDRCAAPQHR